MSVYDIVIVTDDKGKLSTKESAYAFVLAEETALLAFLTTNSKQIRVARLSWKEEFDWSLTKAVIVRSPFDYYVDDLSNFLAWLDLLEKLHTQVMNSVAHIRWNIDKHYLAQLHSLGCSIPDSIFIEKSAGTAPSLLQLLHSREHWAHGAVLKPTVSSSAANTYHITSTNAHTLQDIFNALFPSFDFIFQQYLPEIKSKGEVSLIFINGKYLHAVLKKPTNDDFRVQCCYGGVECEYIPSAKEITFANSCLALVPFNMPLFARVDVVSGQGEKMYLMELELIEPQLYFPSLSEKSNERLVKSMAKEILRRLGLRADAT